MNENKPRFTVLKVLIAIIAIVNLIILFTIQYDFSRLFPHNSNSKELHASAANENMDTENLSNCQFLFDSETLVYDGNGSPDLMDGVVLQDDDGNSLDEKIYISISTENRLQEKTVH